MKINLPFGIKEKEDWNYFAEENNAEGGIWPLANNMRWHTGIHLKPNKDKRYSLLRPLIPGTIVASRFCDDYKDSPFGSKYSNSFVLMKHYFGSKRIPFYILYSELGSKKAIEEHEFIPYEDEEGNEIYRPLFCRRWNLKDNSVEYINKHVVAYYSDKEKTNIKGYLNRDGEYVILRTPNGFMYRKTKESEYYIKNDSGKIQGFTSSTNGEKKIFLANTLETTNSCSYELYYDEKFYYPKLEFFIDKKTFPVNKDDISKEITIEFNSSKDYNYTFNKGEFYIITKQEIKFTGKGKEYKIDNVDIISNFSNSAFTIDKKNKKYVNNSISTPITQKLRCFKGDVIALSEKVNSIKITKDNIIYQYKVKKTKSGCDCNKSWQTEYTNQKGYIKIKNNDKSDKVFTYYEKTSTLYCKNNLSNNTFPQVSSHVIAYDKPEQGLTIIPQEKIKNAEVIEVKKCGTNFYALIKFDKLDETYQSPAITNEDASYFYGYVKLNINDTRTINDCIKSAFKKDYKNTVVGSPSDISEEYNGPIAIFDRNSTDEITENSFELHIELFFTSLDDFNFKKTLKKKDGSIDDLIEIEDKSILYEATNMYKLGDTKLPISRMKFFTDEKNKLVRLKYIKELFISFSFNLNAPTESIIVNVGKKSKVIKIQYEENADNKYLIFPKGFVEKKLNIKIPKNCKDKFEIKKTNENSLYEFNASKYKIEAKTEESDYMIFSTELQSSTADNPKSLSDNTLVFKGNDIQLQELTESKTVKTNSQLMCYEDALSIKIDGIDFYKFNTPNGETYFIKQDDLDNISVMTEKFSTTEENADGSINNIESSKFYNVFDLPSFVLLKDTSEDYICDVDELFEKTGLNKDKIQQEKTIEEIVYNNQDQKLYKQLTRLVIQCPSMWELPEKFDDKKNDYIRDFGYWGVAEGKDTDDLVEYLKDLFFITTEKDETGKSIKESIFDDKIGNTKNYFYFHPLRFLQYYTEKTIQEVNPYCGRVMVSNSLGGINIVKNNPGFAPAWINKGTSDECYQVYLSKIKGNQRFAIPTGLFNENYITATPRYIQTRYEFYHEGIDFRGSWDTSKYVNEGKNEKGTPIYSFIFGEIKSYGWNGYYGQSIIVKREKSDDYYLLAHLSHYMDNIITGKKIGPGDIVGYVGASGNSTLNYYQGPHLHISYFKYTGKNVIDINNKIDRNYGFLEPNQKSYLRNPIDHEVKKDGNIWMQN